ncbi:SGNH/GDSL hydrolase family protein [Actinoplanes oblitus]|uniref:SGNH/GDSL hydrolase family protein n=1 Tax=Actinoplanes oblitus TaxID=3040509 RepID=A0ABY8WMI3_9ACTN|nr:SGNH/GDSL hydrolase family protein [Actinoplanes oblitus]WIM99101.1 SGNH/GDSL hydrolase family protein [Actinoplanes oblitus]
MGDHPVLCTGDSITDCGRRDDPAGLGNGYVRLLAEAPALARTRVINTGVGGDLSSDLAARWAGDVLAHEPAVVSVLIGINDVWRRYDGAGRVTGTAEFEANLRRMLGTLAPSVRLVLIEPFVLPVTAEQHRWEADDLGAKRLVIRELAAEFGAAFVPAQHVFSAAAEEHGAAALASDGVHPTALGHAVLAAAWLAHSSVSCS